MRVYAVVLAAGRGERFGSDKMAATLRGRPMWKWGFDTLASHPDVCAVGVACTPEHVEAVRALVPHAAFVVAGGTTRQQSAPAALDALPADAEALLIHDGARPFVDAAVISRVVAGVAEAGAAAPGIAVVDTVKRLDDAGHVETLDRSRLLAMQTPQGARVDLLRRAFAGAGEGHTDELSMIEALGVVPKLVAGSEGNFKITLPGDLDRAKAIAGEGESRTGIGYDVHAFSTADAPLVLGGETFEGTPRLAGHSDADALLHAVCDALLGAAALGDIGQHFPNTDPQWKDRPSIEFVRAIGAMLVASGWRIVNIDATVIAEFPKVMDRSVAIRGNIAGALGIDATRVSIKATTNERLGALGRGEGIAAFATATLAGAS